jgi:hypothetical protein
MRPVIVGSGNRHFGSIDDTVTFRAPFHYFDQLRP